MELIIKGLEIFFLCIKPEIDYANTEEKNIPVWLLMK